jgi:hypothetical protein
MTGFSTESLGNRRSGQGGKTDYLPIFSCGIRPWTLKRRFKEHT